MSRVANAAEPRPVTPLGILVEHLETAVQMVAQSNVSADIKTHLQTALQLAAGLDPYIEECTTKESPALSAIAQKTSHWFYHCYSLL